MDGNINELNRLTDLLLTDKLRTKDWPLFSEASNSDDTLASFWHQFLVSETVQSVIFFWCQKLVPDRVCSVSCWKQFG